MVKRSTKEGVATRGALGRASGANLRTACADGLRPAFDPAGICTLDGGSPATIANVAKHSSAVALAPILLGVSAWRLRKQHDGVAVAHLARAIGGARKGSQIRLYPRFPTSIRLYWSLIPASRRPRGRDPAVSAGRPRHGRTEPSPRGARRRAIFERMPCMRHWAVRPGCDYHWSNRPARCAAGHFMSYDYDVFLSYRRWAEWPRWVERHFSPLLTHWLGEELGRPPQVFIDSQIIEVGEIWPTELTRALARTRVLVCLWSRSYFDSSWCLAELSHMLTRQDETGARLILPATVHDGDRIPASLMYLQTARLNDCANPRMTVDSPASEQLSDLLQRFAVPVASAVNQAPPFRRAWESDAQKQIHAALDGTIRHDPITLPRIR